MAASLRGPLVALGLTVAGTGAAVYAVHREQQTTKQKMHRQVLKDIEEERRKLECAMAGGPCEAKPPGKAR